MKDNTPMGNQQKNMLFVDNNPSFSYRAQGPCPYLPNRFWASVGKQQQHMSKEEYLQLTLKGFRRVNNYYYRPACYSCGACVPLRLPVKDLVLSRSQKRAWKKNKDLEVSWVKEYKITNEHKSLYTQYTCQKHGQEPPDQTEWDCLLEEENAFTSLFEYRIKETGELIAFSLVDLIQPAAFNSIYFAYQPQQSKRSLGVFSVLYECDWAKNNGYEYYYLGYWVENSTTMRYKNSFNPCETLQKNGQWENHSIC